VSVLVVDVGTSSVRSGLVRPDGRVEAVVSRPCPPLTPADGLAELDGSRLAAAVLETARAALAQGGPAQAVGITNQRGSALVWDRRTGQPVGPGLGWQDLRTAGTCLALRDRGIHLAPNEAGTKMAAILDQADPRRRRAGELACGTVDSWVAWVLSEGQLHVTDATNAGITGLLDRSGQAWAPEVLEALRLPAECLPEVVDSSGVAGPATALPGAPPIAGIIGDQQASLVGQGATRPGLAKATFGTGAMLDVCTGTRPPFARRGPSGTFPIAAWRRAGVTTWGLEAMMLTAGAAVDWLWRDLGLIDSPAASAELAASCPDTADVWFVPALMGMGTPVWDFGARGTLLGLTRGSGRAEVTRAVLEGVAHRGADLAEAAAADWGRPLPSLRVDGGMSANPFFVQALADACQLAVEVSPQLEATTLGAGYVAGLAVGLWGDEEELASLWSPRRVVEPAGPSRRERWLEARQRALRTVPELSSLDFS
jgi:glycerol kinase